MIKVKYSELAKLAKTGVISILIQHDLDMGYYVFVEFPSGEHGVLVVQNTGLYKAYKTWSTVEKEIIFALDIKSVQVTYA